MFGLLTRSTRRSSSRSSRPAPRTRLGLERLEGRDCPSGLSISFNYTHGASRTVLINGSVTEDAADTSWHSHSDLGNLTVTFSGAVQGTAQTDGNGAFQVTLTANSLGAFWGQTSDSNGNTSDYYQQDVTNTAPSISLSCYQGLGGWVLTGSVSDEYAPGLTVRFSSGMSTINNRTTTVAYNGQFGLAVTLPSGSHGGEVSARVTDWWGAQSNVATTYISV